MDPAGRLASTRNSLVVSTPTCQEDLLGEPTIIEVHGGPCQISWLAAGVPHDCFPSGFLMRNKGFVRAPLP